jgi:hypothetical protein
MDKFEPVDRQPYRAEITDQGTTLSKQGTPVVKLYARVLGKPGTANPDELVDPIPAGFKPEVELVFWLDENDANCGYRARDLVENLGWDPDTGVEGLDPRTPGHLNVVGKRVTIAPTHKGEKTYWNFCRQERKLRRFVGDQPVEALKPKNAGIMARYRALKEKKNDGAPAEAVAAGEAIPF